MAKKPAQAKVDPNSLRIAQSKIVLAVTFSKEYKAIVGEEADRIGRNLKEVAEDYYSTALNNIANVVDGGLRPATAPLGTRRFEAPGEKGTETVEVELGKYGKPRRGKMLGNEPLSKSWLREKKLRSMGNWKPRFGSSRKKSVGPNDFWRDTRKLGAKFEPYRDMGKAIVLSRIVNRRGGISEITFRIALNKLPSRYLDLAIRRSLIQGAGGPDRATAILDFSASHAVTSSRPTGVRRGFWPEVWRPTMRPIAQRLGRALKKQLIKTINRR